MRRARQFLIYNKKYVKKVLQKWYFFDILYSVKNFYERGIQNEI